jgi:hypothetical protein
MTFITGANTHPVGQLDAATNAIRNARVGFLHDYPLTLDKLPSQLSSQG